MITLFFSVNKNRFSLAKTVLDQAHSMFAQRQRTVAFSRNRKNCIS